MVVSTFVSKAKGDYGVGRLYGGDQSRHQSSGPCTSPSLVATRQNNTGLEVQQLKTSRYCKIFIFNDKLGRIVFKCLSVIRFKFKTTSLLLGLQPTYGQNEYAIGTLSQGQRGSCLQCGLGSEHADRQRSECDSCGETQCSRHILGQ